MAGESPSFYFTDTAIARSTFYPHVTVLAMPSKHLNGRVYDPLISKFLSGDPFVSEPTNGQNYNRYSYVLNNPMNMTDPTGFVPDNAIFKTTYGGMANAIYSYLAGLPDGLYDLFVDASGNISAVPTANTGTAPIGQSPASTVVPAVVVPATLSAKNTNTSATNNGAFASTGGRDPMGPKSAFFDTGKGAWNAGVGFIEGVPNLLSGAIPGGADYVPFMSSYRAQYDTPAFGSTVELLTGVGAFKVLGEFGSASSGASEGGGPTFFRGAKGGEYPSFAPRPGEYKVDPATGFVKDTHGVSVYDNPLSVTNGGRVPHEVDLSSIPDSLRINQRGNDLSHFEIMPKPGANLTPQQFLDACTSIVCK